MHNSITSTEILCMTTGALLAGAMVSTHSWIRSRNSWAAGKKPGDIADIPKYVYGGAQNSNAESSRWYYKGDFVRLRDLTVSYLVPKTITDKIKLDNVRFYVRGSNLWTKAFDEDITFDPEQPITGVNDLQILIQRTISVGLTLGFWLKQLFNKQDSWNVPAKHK